MIRPPRAPRPRRQNFGRQFAACAPRGGPTSCRPSTTGPFGSPCHRPGRFRGPCASRGLAVRRHGGFGLGGQSVHRLQPERGPAAPLIPSRGPPLADAGYEPFLPPRARAISEPRDLDLQRWVSIFGHDLHAAYRQWPVRVPGTRGRCFAPGMGCRSGCIR